MVRNGAAIMSGGGLEGRERRSDGRGPHSGWSAA